ncbi:hypothetical protein J3458_013429 [Metarhizium acridum]|uniref:uncharacterized protein n=1 Tax=Metarhizium acridum TaxID=92637 RepID=UPI001C6ADDA6|nr:hypothetical protein J3458_013429 [Metarhizium acridum]
MSVASTRILRLLRKQANRKDKKCLCAPKYGRRPAGFGGRNVEYSPYCLCKISFLSTKTLFRTWLKKAPDCVRAAKNGCYRSLQFASTAEGYYCPRRFGAAGMAAGTPV